MDREAWGREYREYRYCSVAHIWHHAFPITGRLPSNASGANDTTAQTTQLLLKEPSSGCAAIFCIDAEPEGEFDKKGRGEKRRQG